MPSNLSPGVVTEITVTVEDFDAMLEMRRDWAGYATLTQISQALALGYRVLYVFWSDANGGFAAILQAPRHTVGPR